jgi:hypothetical protein
MVRANTLNEGLRDLGERAIDRSRKSSLRGVASAIKANVKRRVRRAGHCGRVVPHRLERIPVA